MPADALTTTEAGQYIQLTFLGSADQEVSLATQWSTGISQSVYQTILITAPDGQRTVYSSAQVYAGSNNSGTLSLPQDGTYTIQFLPDGPVFGSVTFTLGDGGS
jgi:hypothetical protein